MCSCIIYALSNVTAWYTVDYDTGHPGSLFEGNSYIVMYDTCLQYNYASHACNAHALLLVLKDTMQAHHMYLLVLRPWPLIQIFPTHRLYSNPVSTKTDDKVITKLDFCVIY